MKLRARVTCALVCAVVFIYPITGAGQNLAIYAPHPARTAPPPVRTTNAAPHEVPATTAFWTKATNAPPVSVGAMLLLTDGRVLVHSEPNCGGCTGNYSSWYTLTPDDTGSYVNGTWTQVASLPSGYEPLFFGSAVLADGKVVVQGGNTIAQIQTAVQSGNLPARSTIPPPIPGPPRRRPAAAISAMPNP